MNRVLVSAVLLSFTAASGIGEEKSVNINSREQRIRTLVQLLASKNAALNKLNGIEFPATYDKQAQAVVYLAMMQLLQEGSAAFDVLIDNFDDERYC